jgi:hypothetical protein
MTDEIHRCPCGDWHGRAFCSECFQPRSCGGGASERMLKCQHCGVRTLHIVAGERNRNDPYDYGVRRDPEQEELTRQEAFMRGLFDQLGADLRTAPKIVKGGKPALYEVTRFVRADEVAWVVNLREDLTAAARVWALCEAWESMTSSNVARWSDPDAYHQGDDGWQWTGMFKPLGTATHIDGKPLFQDQR